MTIYIVIWLLFLTISILTLRSKKSVGNNKFYFFILVFLALWVGFRDDIGVDWLNYVFFYENGFSFDKSGGLYEPIFSAVRYLMYPLGFTYQAFFFVLSLFSLCCLWTAANKLKVNNNYILIFVYLSMFFCNMQFNIVRSGIMACCIWKAVSYVIENKKKAVIWTLIAAGFHYIALLFIPILLLLDYEFKKKQVFFLITVSYLILFLKLGTLFVRAFPFLQSFDRVAGFISSDAVSNSVSLGMIINLLIYIFLYNKWKYAYINQIEFRVVLNMLLAGICICSAFSIFGHVATRAGQVANMSLVFLWPYVLTRIPNRNKFICLVLLSLYMLFYYLQPLTTDTSIFDNKLVPYKFLSTGIFR